MTLEAVLVAPTSPGLPMVARGRKPTSRVACHSTRSGFLALAGRFSWQAAPDPLERVNMLDIPGLGDLIADRSLWWRWRTAVLDAVIFDLGKPSAEKVGGLPVGDFGYQMRVTTAHRQLVEAVGRDDDPAAVAGLRAAISALDAAVAARRESAGRDERRAVAAAADTLDRARAAADQWWEETRTRYLAFADAWSAGDRVPAPTIGEVSWH